MGEFKRKLIILLWSGLVLSLCHSPKQQKIVMKYTIKEWKGLNKSHLLRAFNSLKSQRILEESPGKDGTIQIVLSDYGKKLAQTFSLDVLKIKIPKDWDGNWRIVIFDIPEPLKKVRDSLRMHLKNLGFLELQKSVFIHPFPCVKEISYIVEFYNITKFVRIITANSIDNEPELMKHFGIQ